MQNYELVLLLNANTSEADRKAFMADLEAKFTVKEKDEIWIQTLSFKLKDKSWSSAGKGSKGSSFV